MNIAVKRLSPEEIQAIKSNMQDELNREYDFYKRMLYALYYNMDFSAITKIIAVSSDENIRESYLQLSREELISIFEKRREQTHVKLNSINESGPSCSGES